jgi:hypothetical protein
VYPIAHPTCCECFCFRGVQTILCFAKTASACVPGSPVSAGRFFATDNAGTTESPKSLTIKLDKISPVVTCGSADALWHAADVKIGCTGSDGLSGLAIAGEASFYLSTSVPTGTETATAQIGTHSVRDALPDSRVASEMAPRAPWRISSRR